MAIDRKSMSDIVVVVIMSLTSAGLRVLVPMNLLFNGKYDDALMVNMSQHLALSETRWTQLSMMKPIGYPLFVRASLESGISPVLLAHVMYLGGSVFLAWQLRSRLYRPVWTLMVAALVFNPVLFGATASRVYRDVLTMALALIFAAATLALSSTISSQNRARSKELAYCTLIAVLSIILYLVRNDTLWVILLLPFAGVATLIANWKVSRRPGLVILVFGSLLIVGAPMSANLVGAKMNQRQYGVDLADDFYHGWFPKLITQWSRVEVATKRPYTPVNRIQRESGYSHSPTLQRLANSLEGTNSDGWRSISCQATSGEVCDDIAGGYFPFALREAFEDVYQPRTEQEFQSIVKRAVDEISTACGQGNLECGKSGLNVFLPAVNELNVGASVSLFGDYMFARVFQFRDRFMFEGVPPIDGDTIETVRNWSGLVDSSNGQKTSTISGMPDVLRSPIRIALTTASYLLAISSFLGVAGVILGFRLRSATDHIVWTAMSYVVICAIYVAIHSIVGANSFGPMIYDGHKEMSYLVQPTPFVIVAGACGWSILTGAVKSRAVRGVRNTYVAN